MTVTRIVCDPEKHSIYLQQNYHFPLLRWLETIVVLQSNIQFGDSLPLPQEPLEVTLDGGRLLHVFLLYIAKVVTQLSISPIMTI